MVSSAWDVGTCAAMKLRRPARPVILVADRRRGAALLARAHRAWFRAPSAAAGAVLLATGLGYLGLSVALALRR